MKEKLKAFAGKLINKKTITGVVIVIILAAALRTTFLFMFEVEGVVNQVDGSKITVANFLTTQTVDIGNFKTAYSSIQVGDKIKIMKNLSGDVISVRDFNTRNMNEIGKGKRNFKGIDGDNWKGK